MPLSKGQKLSLDKSMEEQGELIQLLAKLSAYPDGNHPDGKGNLFKRIRDEISDVRAALVYLEEQFKIEQDSSRTLGKLALFMEWGDDGNVRKG